MIFRTNKYIDDVLSRAIKTFIQAFCGILIPELVAVLNNGIPEGMTVWAVLLHILGPSFAAGISACWNILNNKLLDDKDDSGDKPDE